MRNKNILELCLAHGLGGLELFVASCYKDFSDKGVCKVVVTPNSKLDNYLVGVDKFYIKRNKFFPFIPAYKLANFIDKNDIDIIHFHWTRDIITAVLAKLISKKKPKLVQSRHMRMTRFKNDFYHKWLYQNIDMIHAVTKDVSQQLIRYIPENIRPKVEMVYLGVESRNTNNKKVQDLKNSYNLDNSFIVGIIGRLEEAKGQHLVIKAVAQLKNFDIKALIIGSPMNNTYLSNLKNQINELGIEDKIVFTGFTKDTDEHLALCDTVVLATTNETFGLVIIEAMANKKAVIATKVGGPLEIIDDNINGLLFDRESDELKEKIELLHNDKIFKNKLAISAYEKVNQKFNKKKQMGKLYDKLNSL